MSFHNKPDYHIPELIEALKAHRLPHDTPSQLADSFRSGWMACRELAQADSVLEDAARWNAWSQALLVEGANCGTEPEFFLQQFNAWIDAARATQKE